MPPSREGDWFALPLEGGGYAVGLVARGRRGSWKFGYFFGPVRREIPRPEDVAGYKPADAVHVAKFRDDALVSGRWPIIMSSPEWDRDPWPMPEFRMGYEVAEITGEIWAVTYDADNPGNYVGQRLIAHEDAGNYPEDTFEPPEVVELFVGERLGIPIPPPPELDVEAVEEGVRHVLLVPVDRVDEVRRQLEEMSFDAIEVLGESDRLVMVEAFQEGDVSVLAETVDSVEATLAALAKRLGGVYDGREWALRPA